MDKGDVAHTHHGRLVSHKENETTPCAATRVGVQTATPSEVGQTERDRP